MAGEEPKKVTGGAFGRYMTENRAALLKECAGKPATASIKLGSERYKSLGAAAQAKYQTMYEEAKVKYEKDVAAFLAAGGEKKARVMKKDKGKPAKDPNRPKKPAGGAFGCFVAKNRPALIKECAGKPITAVSKLAGARWKAMSAAEKQPYDEAYVVKKAAYEQAMKDYVPPAGAADGDAGNDEEDEDGDEDGDGDEEDDAEAETPPTKRKAGAAVDAPAAKKGKAVAAVVNNSEVEAKAKKLGFLPRFKTLYENPKITASPSAILDMLVKHGGSSVKAKHALLGA